MRLLAMGIALASAGCAGPMFLMDPVREANQDLKYRDGTPVLASRGIQADVVVAPKTGPAGQYEVQSRIAFLVSFRNKLDRRIEVSERNVTATDGSQRVSVIRAVALEKEIRTDAAWARVANGVATGLASVDAASAGETTFSAKVGQTNIQGSSYNKGAAMQAKRQVATDAAAVDDAISRRERAELDSLRGVFQRNTVEPGEVYGGVVLVERPETGDCSSIGLSRALARSQTGARIGGSQFTCKLTLKVGIEGETHTFTFREAASN